MKGTENRREKSSMARIEMMEEEREKKYLLILFLSFNDFLLKMTETCDEDSES